MNALALAHGLLRGGHDGARESLAAFWGAVGTQLPFELLMVGPTDSPGLAPGLRALMHWTRLLSPYQLNPLGLNPLRDVLAAQIDFERLRSSRRAAPVRRRDARQHRPAAPVRQRRAERRRGPRLGLPAHRCTMR